MLARPACQCETLNGWISKGAKVTGWRTSLRANWVNEVHKFLPHREAFIATGKPAGSMGEDFTIISYSLLHQWLEVFHDQKTVILDESHNANHPARRRTRSALTLTSRVPDNGLILSLTGTPFVNKPIELATQLRLIKALRYMTPTPEAENDERASAFREQVISHWFKALRRRSQRTRMTWTRMRRLIARWLPPARVMHPFPYVRFNVRTRGRSPVR